MTLENNVARRASRAQSSTGPPEMEMVTVAVVPPRLPPGMAPPTGVGVADAFSWDEAINWQHNNPTGEKAPEPTGAKGLWKKYGISGERQKRNPDAPNFTFRKVPYDVWRKHYAKDAEGNYKGTHAPAEDCLLKPEDVEKWRGDEAPKTNADKYTRGSSALPVYEDVPGSDELPEYKAPADNLTVDSAVDRKLSQSSQRSQGSQGSSGVPSTFTADGKTSAQIIEEAKQRAANQPKKTWKEKAQNALTMALLAEK